jgi:UDP-glucuronate decarboxylase
MNMQSQAKKGLNHGDITAAEVVERDLRYITEHLIQEFSRMAGKRILITGGAGFLGYYLTQSIMHWNDSASQESCIDVTVFDNFSRGMPEWLKEMASNPLLHLFRHDITSPLPEEMPDFSYIIHAASIASPTFYRKYPIETMDANVNGLRFLLEYARERLESRTPIEGLLFFSTSEIYGDPTPDNIPTPETYRGNVSCTGPRACYDESKRYGEALCVNFARQYGIPVTVARPFNNYGPGLKITDKRVLPDFARDIMAKQDIVMYSDGSPTRTFCYVADAVVGYYRILVRGTAGESYNIGVESPEISIGELAELVTGLARELFGYQGRVIRRPSKEADYLVDNPNRRCPIIAKARQEIGYEPSISLEQGMRNSLIWYRENQEAEES